MIVFGIMGIFSAKYRQYAKDAFSCVFRMITLRPCQMNFDDKMRAKIVAKLSARSTKLAGFTYKHFKLISWILVLVTIVSLAFTVQAVYNLTVYGTCDPTTGECIFVPGQEPIGCTVNAPNSILSSVQNGT
jgi:hypothetical protein